MSINTVSSSKKKLAIIISLTDFVEYVSKTGSSKLSVVKRVKNRPPYHPSRDYWKILRDAIESYHQGTFSDLNAVLKAIAKVSKVDKYRVVISRYLSFIRSKEIKWFAPLSGQWKNDSLIVKLNPEIGLKINGEKYLIKLYFKDTPLTKSQAELILTLMNTELRKEGEYRLALLDICSHKLHTDKKLAYDKLIPLLIGEAKSFESIWNSI